MISRILCLVVAVLLAAAPAAANWTRNVNGSGSGCSLSSGNTCYFLVDDTDDAVPIRATGCSMVTFEHKDVSSGNATAMPQSCSAAGTVAGVGCDDMLATALSVGDSIMLGGTATQIGVDVTYTGGSSLFIFHCGK